MSTLERLSLRVSLVASAFLNGLTGVLAATPTSNFGPIPNIGGVTSTTNLQTALVNALNFVLNFLAVLATIFIVVAGIRLIVSAGEDTAKDKAKKTILYVVIGLIVILFAKFIVNFFINEVPSQIG